MSMTALTRIKGVDSASASAAENYAARRLHARKWWWHRLYWAGEGLCPSCGVEVILIVDDALGHVQERMPS